MTTRRLIPLIVAAFAAVFSVAGPGVAAITTDIQRVDLDDWPNVEISLAAPKDASDSLTVTEDGALVTDVDVKTFTESGRGVDVMLVIDTSGSMEGEPIAAARQASRAFVGDAPDNMRIGIVTFSDRPRVALRLTYDREAALDVLAGAQARGETALYDGVKLAANSFSGSSQRNMVLLSDGGDTVSRSSLNEAVGAAKDASTSIYSVGLTTGEADVPALKRLSAVGKGRYAPAGTADLSSLYRGLVVELENQYVISYRSEQEPGSEFTLAITADGVADSALISAPDVAAPPARSRPAEVDEPLLQGRSGLIVVLSLSFVASGLLAWGFVGSTVRRRRDAELSRLMAASPQAARAEAESTPNWIPDSLAEIADNFAQQSGWSSKLDLKLDRAGVSLSPGEFMTATFLAAVAGIFVGALLTDSVLLALLLGVLTAFVPNVVMSIKIRRRFKKLEGQLPDILMIIATSLRAGHSFLQALDAVAAEIGDPGSHEFSRLVGEIRLGRSVTDAMNDLAERIGSDDFNWAILAVNIQREVGGNLAEVLDTVASTMRGRANVRRQVNVLSAEGRLSMYILGALPLLIAVYLWAVNREYLSLLYTSGIGIAMLILAGFLYVSGFFWMRKVVKIDV